MTETRWARARDVVWRLAPDRVLVRRVGDRSSEAAAELVAAAALVWVALDEPASVDELGERLVDAELHLEVRDVDATVADLERGGWVERTTT